PAVHEQVAPAEVLEEQEPLVRAEHRLELAAEVAERLVRLLVARHGDDRGDRSPRLVLALVHERLVAHAQPAWVRPAVVAHLYEYVALGLAGADAAQQAAVLGRDGGAVLVADLLLVAARAAPEDVVDGLPREARGGRVARNDPALLVVHEHGLLERGEASLEDG